MITEADFLKQVIDLAHLLGWVAHHTRPAMTSKGWRTPLQGDAGFPDLVLVHGLSKGGRVIFAELKSEKGKLSDAQNEWINILNMAIQEVYVWRPSEWEEIIEVLKR